MSTILGSTERKTSIHFSSLTLVRDGKVVTQYSPGMRKLNEIPESDPLKAWDYLYQRYPLSTAFGRQLRQAVAKTWLHNMNQIDAELAQREAADAESVERITRLQSEHELNMQYLIHFGVTLQEREAFRKLLEEVVMQGDLTILKAVDQVCRHSQRNGEASPGEGLTPVAESD